MKNYRLHNDFGFISALVKAKVIRCLRRSPFQIFTTVLNALLVYKKSQLFEEM